MEAFTLVFAALLFIAAAIADRYGRKRVMMVGLVIFALASAYAPFFATTAGELIASRAIMGIGGALVMPTTLSLVNVVFPSKERPKAIAIWAAVSGVGMMLGSVLTGLLLHFFDWHSAFLLGAAFGLIAIPITARIVPESVDEKATPVDWIGGLFVTLALAGIVYTIMEAPSHGWETLAVVAAAVGALALAAFIWWENRVEHPMLDLSLFKRRRFTLSVVSVTLTFFAMIGAFYSMTQIFQGHGVRRAHLGRRDDPADAAHDDPWPAGAAHRRQGRDALDSGAWPRDHRRGLPPHDDVAHRAVLLGLLHRDVDHHRGYGVGHDPGDQHAHVLGAAQPLRHGLCHERHHPRAWARRSASPCWARSSPTSTPRVWPMLRHRFPPMPAPRCPTRSREPWRCPSR
nr:MFS transporter [Demequina litorisediminis]